MKKYSKDTLLIILCILFICVYIAYVVPLEMESMENAKNGICTCGATEYCIGN